MNSWTWASVVMHSRLATRTMLCLPMLLLAWALPASGKPVAVGPEFQVNTYTTNAQFRPAVAAHPIGGFLVVWAGGQDGGYSGVAGQRYDSSGVPVGSEFQINTYTTSSQTSPAVAADGLGFIVVWESYDAGFMGNIFGQRYDSAGARLGNEFRVNTYTTLSQGFPAVAANDSDGFLVVWNSSNQDGSNSGIFGQRYDSVGAPLGSDFQVNTYTTLSQSFPAAAADGSGGFLVVWDSDEQDSSDEGVFGQRYGSSGAPLGGEFRVNTYTTASQRRPSVAADGSGNFVVVWTSIGQDAGTDGAFGQRYDSAGAPLGNEFQVNSYTTSYQDTPAVTSSGSGGFLVVWESIGQDGGGDGIFGQTYDDTGAPLGSEFQVNTYTTAFQSVPVPAANPSGEVLVVWASFGPDGSGNGIFGQRFVSAPSNCCVNNGTPGCDDPTCQTTVCAMDAFCCGTVWDQICADLAFANCPVCAVCGDGTCGPGENDVTCAADCGCTADPLALCGADATAPSGCFCDEICAAGGDCCADVCGACPALSFCCGNGVCDFALGEDQFVCPEDCGCSSDPPLLCGVSNEKAPSGCFCDEVCQSNGDCCPDVCTACPARSFCPGCGDVNGIDGVNVGDALLVAQYDVELRECGVAPFDGEERCDIAPAPTGDGQCDIGDALLMAQCDAGLVPCDFTCPPFVCPAP